MVGAEEGVALKLSGDARTLIHSQIEERTRAFFLQETERQKRRTGIFLSVNIAGLIGIIASIWAAASFHVKAAAKEAVAESKIIESQVEAIATSAVDATKQLADVKNSLDLALIDVNTAGKKAAEAVTSADDTIREADLMRTEAADNLARFKKAMEQAGDAELLRGFERLKQLSDKLNGSAAESLHDVLRSDAESYIQTEMASVVPIGTILAWHKDLDGIPELPAGWIECNGPVRVGDADFDESAKFDLSQVPNLNNGRDGYGRGLFLRGWSESGHFQHATHHATSPPSVTSNHNAMAYLDDGTEQRVKHGWARPFDRSQETKARTADLNSVGKTEHIIQYDAARPVNYSVVWIIRVR